MLSKRLAFYTLRVRLFGSSSPKFTQKESIEGHYCRPKAPGVYNSCQLRSRDRGSVYGTGCVCVEIIFCQETAHKHRQSFSFGFGSCWNIIPAEAKADSAQRRRSVPWLQLTSSLRRGNEKCTNPFIRCIVLLFQSVTPPTCSLSLPHKPAFFVLHHAFDGSSFTDVAAHLSPVPPRLSSSNHWGLCGPEKKYHGMHQTPLSSSGIPKEYKTASHPFSTPFSCSSHLSVLSHPASWGFRSPLKKKWGAAESLIS